MIWLALGLGVAVNLLMLTGPVYMLQVYDRVLSSGSIATLTALFVIMVALYGFLAIYDFLRVRVLSRAGYRMEEICGPAAFAQGLQKPEPTAEAEDSLQTLTDVQTVRSFLCSPAMPGLLDLPWVPLFTLLLFFIHPWLGMLTLAGAAVTCGLAIANAWATSGGVGRGRLHEGRSRNFGAEVFRNSDLVGAMALGNRVAARWRHLNNQGLLVIQASSDTADAFTVISRAFRMFLQSALLTLSAYLVLKQELSAGMIMASSVIAGRALAPVDQAIGNWRAVVQARGAWTRLRVPLSALAGVAPVALPPPKDGLIVAGLGKLTMAAPNGARTRAPILEDITFALKPGDALGIIGTSASGKSTLGRLLVGADRPEFGSVRLGGATPAQWSASAIVQGQPSIIGYLPQTVRMMPGTLRDNICGFDPAARDENIIAAATTAGVHEMALQLPQGYGTPLGMGQDLLSGGQLQRIGLARALYGSPRFLVLDEPDAHLDPAGELALVQAIARARQDGTIVILITHRQGTLAVVNHVLVLRQGRIHQIGPREEVLAGPRVVPPPVISSQERSA